MINTYGTVYAKIRLSKDNNSFIYKDELTGEYDSIEANTESEAIEYIKSNIEDYYSNLNDRGYSSNNGMDDKIHYINEFAEYFDIDLDEAIENHFDIDIELIDIDTSDLEVEIVD